MHRVFDQQAAGRPDAVAIECGEQRWTYAEIAAASRFFAADLQRAGVRPGAIVGIGIGRSVEFVVAVLAVLRCGAAYVPLLIDDPVDRLASMVDSAGVTAIVTAGDDLACAPLLRARPGLACLPLGRCLTDPGLGRLDALKDGEEPACDPEDPAYVMFTSGSTGTPKGVVVPHRAVVGLVTGQSYADFGPEMRTLMAAPTAFDASTFELWGPLLHGGTVMIYPDRYFDLHRFGEVVQAGRVTCLWLTAGLFNRVIDLAPETLSPVRHVLTGGDVLSVTHVRRAFEALPGIRLTNGYGPTETTTFACTQVIDPADTFPHGSVPIGRPLAHTSCLILSADGQIVSDGEPGELWIGGSGVAKGYLTLSEGRFVADPRPGGDGRGMYRSGDRCRRLPDGSLLFLGRIDQQVKIRGHRVEPGEIEATLLRHPAVRSAAVIPLNLDGETSLAAFIDRGDGGSGPIQGFHAWLEACLPQAFVPARLVPIVALPVNTNGKVDRKALLALLAEDEPDDRGEPPRPGTESRVASLWHALLRRHARGRDDDFFALGGHSLLAMRLMAAIEREFRVRLPVTTIFETRTVSRLAVAIDAAVADGASRRAAEGFTADSPIPPTEERILPALPAQRGMWLLDALLPDRATYNQPFAFRPDGPIDWERFRESLRRVMTRHPALRSAFEAGDDGPVQRIALVDEVAVPWSEEPLVDATVIEAALRAHARIPFDLATAPLWRATLFPAAAPHGVLLLNFHHAIIDDWSIELLLHDLASPTDVESEGTRPAAGRSHLRLPALGPAERDRCTRFWRETLADATGELAWPGRWTPSKGGPTGGMLRFAIEADTSASLQAISRETGATLFQILLAAFHGWLHRMTGADDIVVGTPVSLRSTPEVQESVNCFLNTLPVRVHWDDDEAARRTFTNLIGEVTKTFLATVSHRDLPFDEIVAAAAHARAGERSPIVTTLFVHTDKGLASALLDGVSCAPILVETGTAKFDLTLFLEGDGRVLQGAFEYDRRRFDPETIAGFATSFSVFLQSMLSAPTAAVATAALLDAGGRQRMLHDLAGSDESSTPSGGLLEPFRDQVEATPDAIAVTWWAERWTYRELHAHGEQIATRLRHAGAAKGMPVGICLPRSPELQAAILGVLMTKACCVPLDPTLPTERLASMVAIAGCSFIVSGSRTAALVETLCNSIPPEGARPRTVRIDSGVLADEVTAEPAGEVPHDQGNDHLAYILFTSGSTGVPKGVEMPVGPIANLVAWQCRESVVGRGARTLQFASAGFDVSFQELFSTWLSGGELVIVPEEARLDPAALLELVMDHAVERIFLPVAVLEHLAEGSLATGRFPSSLREVIVAGEQLRIGPAIRGFFASLPACILWNQYGPTESHVVTSQILDGDPSDWPNLPVIGRPVAGASIRVLDGAMEPVPVGVPGEIWIGGDCLARGYVGRADLTAERFIDDPFAAEPGHRMYRSGDIGRWRDDGRLEYLGRVDRQVKIRGHRVEPDEIEAVLSGHPLVAEAAVVVRRDDTGTSFLVAHVVPVPSVVIVPSDLVAWLAARLPAAMIPLRIGVHESLPLTPNGKLDRHSLERSPLPQRAEVGAEITDERPLDGAEQAIAEIWLAVLGRGVPRRHDDFFHAGGTSLSAMRLVARARKRFGINASVRNVFDHPTVAALAAHWLGASPVPLADAPRSPTVSGTGDDATVPALPAQRAMWFLQTLLPDRATYNQPFGFRPDGPIDWDRFREALQRVLARHPALRTSLEAGDDGPVQRIAPVEKVPVPWSEEPLVDATVIEAALRAHARIPFDLATAPLWRATLFPAAAPHGVLLLNFHHAIIDDWSIDVCLADLGRAYVSLESSGTLNASTAFAPMAVPAMAGPLDPIADKNFWTAELTGIPDGVRWPGVIGHAAAATFRGETRRFRLDVSVADAWRGIAREADATLFAALFAAFHAWVHRATGSEDTVIATPVAGRGVEGLEEAVGCFLNTLPIRVRWGGDPALAQGPAGAAIRRVRDTFLTALDHGQLPFDEIVTSVPGRQAGRRHPLTNVMFVFLEPTDPTWALGPARMEKVDVDTGTSRFDLTLSLVAGSDGIEGTVEYSTDVLVGSDVERFVAGFITLLGAVAADPGVAIRDIDLLAVDERRRVLHDFNATATDLGAPATLQELFSAQVCRTPAAVAVESGNEILSYAELAGRVNRLARFLRSRGVGRDVPVAVCLERSVEMVVALLGIVTAGGAYLPLDPEVPPARLSTMLASASPPVVLVQERFRDRVAGAIGSSAGEVFQVDAQRQELAAFDDGPLDDIATPEDLAYVIYTSGSTGAPKGVMNTHAGIVNRLRWIQQKHALEADDRVLQKTPYGFDVSVWEFFWPLLVGARLVMLPPGFHREPSAIAKVVEATGITVIHFVPSMLEVFLDVPGLERSCRTLRHVFCSGEALPEGAARLWLERLPARIHNLYGPTEAAVEATFHECRLSDRPGPVPIGRPIANMRTYVLDAALRPVGVGIEGELWLAGVGVARGYLGRPDLTAERFLLDPFSGEPGARMYRTGDLARWRHDGEIEYLGRLDHQVKIRGVRIELGEIEAELERIEGVTRGVVIDREIGPGDRRLVAYLIADPSAPTDEALKVLLAARLPEAMVPWRIVRVDALPVNANGKLDRAALPSPDAAIDAVEASPRSAPVGETEEALAAIWCELLGIPTVGRDDGFFARGGHSLLSMRLVAAIERRFGVRLPVKTVFESPKLAELAARISQPLPALPESAVALTTIPASAEVIDCRPLPAQRGMWLLHSLLPDPATYNVPIAWRVDGPIDWPRMERSLAAVVARHPALRTALVEVDGDLVQRVLPTAAVAVPWRVVTIAEESGLQSALEHEASTPFDLAIAPLLRAVRIDIAGAEPVLMLTFHHAIIDEWSIGIVRADLAAAYAAADAFDDRSLPVVTSARDSVDIERDRRFWREELAAAPAETPLPGRSVAAVVESSRGRTSRFTVERDALDRLRGLAERCGVTVFNVLLASVHAWLERITGQRDLVIGTPVATRGAAETTAAVGCLINVLPVRVRFDEGASADPLTLPGLAERVQGIFLRALDHADLPFDQIVAAAMPTRQGSRQPLVNVLLTVVETGNRAWRIGAATLRPEPIDAGRARFDLSLTLEIGPDGLEGSLEFPPDRYDADFVAGFAARYAAFLAEAAARPTVPIEQMAMLPDADRRRVIEEFNETEVDLGGATTLHQLVQEQAARTPSACAVREGEAQITYDALQQRAARLATRLRGLGIGSGDRVGVALPRSIDATVAMLAVLRSGAAWVPLDREAPPARLAFIVDDAQLSAIIDSHHAAGGWPEGIPVIDPEAADLGDRAEDDFPDVAPEAAAYVMYTSGSTGQPKGVVIPHAAVVNYLRGKQRRFPLDAADICLHATRTTFDISVYEVFGPLLAGAVVVILPAGRTDPARIAELVRSAAVTVAQFVPSLLALLVDDETLTACPTLRRVFCGGEAMPSGLMERFLSRSDAELVNVYGPTEATVWATAWVCRRSERAEMPPIGRPLDNVRCYVLDAGCRPVPVGTVGELFIGGAQLAIGYHHRPDLTAARFLPDPFLPGPGERMYRTGDVCRWRPDGLLEFVARNDTQVKIRGHRIEPAEIEACLAGHPQIGAVAVVAITPLMPVMAVMPVMADGTLSLVAAVVPRESGLDIETLRRWTAERLPEVMVPSRFVCLDALPVNANGKIDRRALAGQIAESSVGLPAPLPQVTGSPGVVPVFLSQVRAAWQRLFGRVDFGDQDNFFHDLGGQSIMAARLVADLSTVLGRRVPLAAVFEAPTVASMAALLRDEGWTPRFRSIVPLQPLGVGPPVFLFHGVGGGVTENLELARAFAPDVPVYGLQAIDRDGGAMQTSLEAFAELYAAEIVAFQPRGPYFLGGFSLGGWFAYETAQQLRRGGHEVALLAQFDTHINCLLPDEVLAAADRVLWRQYVWKHLRRLASQPSQGWRYLRGLPARFKLARQWRAVDPIRGDSHGALVARHRALPYAGSIDYFQSADSLPAVLGVWKRWCAGGLTVHQIPGDHHEVIFGANAATIANIVRGIRGDRARQAGSPAEPAERRQV